MLFVASSNQETFQSCPLLVKDSWDREELDDVFARIKQNSIKKVVVLCGAGLSTASGIADFRSPRIGLYDNVSAYNLPYPEALFELDFLKRHPRSFFQYYKGLMMQLRDQRFQPNLAHHFLKLLQEKGILLRVYTQNIDGLELSLNKEYLVQCHGNIDTAACVECKKNYTTNFVELHLKNNTIPYCNTQWCRGRKGIVKPNVIFFGEDLPMRFWMHRSDLQNTDLVLVMGTSMTVEPFNKTLNAIPSNCPVIVMNNKRIRAFENLAHPRKLFLPGDLVESVQKFTASLDWSEELSQLSERTAVTSQKIRFSATSKISETPRKDFYDKWSKQEPRGSLRSSTSLTDRNSSSTSRSYTLTSLSSSISETSRPKKSKSGAKRKKSKKKKCKKKVKKAKNASETKNKKQITANRTISIGSNPYPNDLIELVRTMKLQEDSRKETNSILIRKERISGIRELVEFRQFHNMIESPLVEIAKQKKQSLMQLELWRGPPAMDGIYQDDKLNDLLRELDSIPLPVF